MMSRTSRSVAAPGLMFGTGFTEAHTLYIHHVPDLSPVLPQRRHENTPGMWFSVQV